MTRILALLSIVAFIGFGIWAVMIPADSTDSSTVLATADAGAGLEEVPELDAPVATDPEVDIPAAVERTDFVPLAPVKDASVRYGEEVEGGILVAVVDADSGDALPHAEVMVIDLGVIDSSALNVEMMRQPDFESLFLHFGVVYPTDENGQVCIPYPEERMLLAGRTTTHFDFAFDVDLNQDQVELEIKRVDLLRIRVVDAAGQPIEGAPVGLRQRRGDSVNSLMRNLTDESGWANLRLFALLIDNLASTEVYAALLGLFEEPIEAPVDLTNLPNDGVTLVMPEVGSLTVNLVDAEGNPLVDYLAVTLNTIDANQPMAGEETRSKPDLVNTTATGTVVFSAIGFDLIIDVQASNLGGILSGAVIVHGPTTANPHVEVEIALKMEASVIKGRLVNEEGKPGPNLTLKSDMEVKHTNRSSSTGSQIRTDKDGYFRVKLDEPTLGSNATRTLTLTFKATRKKPERNVVIDLSRDYPPGETDLGDVMLTVPPIAASGVVLKPDGTPLRDAEVRLERRTHRGNNQENIYWENLWKSRAKTNRDGHFTIAGYYEAGIYRLRLNSSHFPTLFHEINLGAEELEITMPTGGSIKGVLLLDEGVPRDAVELVLDRHPLQDLDGNDRGKVGVSVNRNGEFVRHGLSLGSVDVIVRATSTTEELFRIDGVAVRTSDDTPHDIGVLDLRGKLTWFTLKFVDSANHSVGRVQIQPKDMGFSRWVWDGRIEVVTAKPSMDFTVSSEGYRTAELSNISIDTTVTLQDGVKVRVRVANPDLIPIGYLASLSLHKPSARTKLSHMTGGNMELLDNNYEQVLATTNPGTYRVECSIAKAGSVETQGWWRIGSDTEGMLIEVLDVSGEQLFIITLDQDNIDEILGKLDE